jgi:hypothetical protein
MHVDVDQALLDLPPWDLTVTIDGGTYRVREVTERELGRLRALPLAAQPAGVLGFTAGLFEGPAPDVSRWTGSELLGLVCAVSGYLVERVQLAAAAAEAAGRAAAALERQRHSAGPIRKAGE